MTATRCPASRARAARSWTCTPRTRAPARREDLSRRPPDGARQSVPVTTVPTPRQREDAVDVEPGRPRRGAARQPAASPVERGAAVVQARARARRDGHPSAPGSELRGLGRAPARVAQVGLGHRDHAVLARRARPAPRGARGSAASRRRRRPRRGGTGRSPRRARDHRAHEALVARHVDRPTAAVREGSSSGAKPSSIEMPRSLSSGRRSVSLPVSAPTSAVLPWSMWPAVPSVSGGSLTRSRRPPSAPARVGLGVGQRARVEQQRARRATRADHAAARRRAAARGQAAPSCPGRRRTPAPSSSSSGSAPPPTCAAARSPRPPPDTARGHALGPRPAARPRPR